jgi:hypothetical protein
MHQQESMSKGILLIAYGKHYGKFAYNMAASIKACTNLNIHLVCDKEAISDIDLRFFDSVETYNFPLSNNRIDPCQTKIDIYKMSPFDETLYLDVDGVCMNNLDDLFDKLKGHPIYIQIMGKGGEKELINYSYWADNKVIWEHFNLSEASIYPASQTSIIYFEKGKESDSFFAKLQSNYENRLDKKKYKNMWGLSNSHPDELYYSATMAQLNILPNETIQPLFYPIVLENEAKIMKDYFVLSMYGGQRMLKDYSMKLYNRLMKQVLKGFGLSHQYDSYQLYKHKFVAQK